MWRSKTLFFLTFDTLLVPGGKEHQLVFSPEKGGLLSIIIIDVE